MSTTTERKTAQERREEIVEYVERVSGAEPDEIRNFMAMGMLLNVITAMDLLHDEEGWAARLLAACRYQS